MRPFERCWLRGLRRSYRADGRLGKPLPSMARHYRCCSLPFAQQRGGLGRGWLLRSFERCWLRGLRRSHRAGGWFGKPLPSMARHYRCSLPFAQQRGGLGRGWLLRSFERCWLRGLSRSYTADGWLGKPQPSMARHYRCCSLPFAQQRRGLGRGWLLRSFERCWLRGLRRSYTADGWLGKPLPSMARHYIREAPAEHGSALPSVVFFGGGFAALLADQRFFASVVDGVTHAVQVHRALVRGELAGQDGIG